MDRSVSRRGLVLSAGIVWGAAGPVWRVAGQEAMTPEGLIEMVGKRYREMEGVELEATVRTEVGLSDSTTKVRLGVRPGVRGNVIVYEAEVAALGGRMVQWTDGARLRTYESKGRKYFDGPAEGTARRSMADGLEKVAERYWRRFGKLTGEWATGKVVKEGEVKLGKEKVACWRVEVRAAEVVARDMQHRGQAMEELWVEKRSGIVLRSVMIWPGAGMVVRKQTDWGYVKPGAAPEEAVAFGRPAGAVDVSEPVMLGK